MILFVKRNIFGVYGSKWLIHVVEYMENEWSLNIYEIQDKYTHLKCGIITILINRETYQPYSCAKSCLK